MAERNVAVRLSANVSSYVAAMAKAKAATTGLSESGRSLTQLGGAMQSVGRTATIGVTLPLLAVGAGAVSMAAKFDAAFAQMVGLANVPAAEIDGLKESVLSLAGETAVAPQELAEGLYFAASAGLDASAAMDAVALAARASAAGMGTTQDVVGLVASAVASYGEANITAAEATDILTSTIREGRAEPAELASTLGRVLPIAADLGVTFDDVGAATALLTNVFGDTNRAVTALQGVFVKLSTPTKQGREALAEFGLTVGDIKAAIAEDGLLGALKLLQTSGLAGSSAAMAKLFDDIEGRQGVLALLGTDAETLNGTFEALDNSAGSLDTAFNAVSDTAGFKMKQAMTDIKVATIEVGDILLPLAADIASTISGMIGWFTDLSPAVQGVVVAFGGILAAAGPALIIAGSLVKNWTAVSTAFGNLSRTAQKMGKALGVIAIAAGLAFIGYEAFTAEQKKTDQVTRDVSTSLLLQMGSLFAAADAAGYAADEIDGVALANEALSLALADGYDELGEALADLNVGAESTMTILGQLGNDPVMAMDNLARSFGFTAEEASHLNGITFDSFGVWRGQAERLNGEFGISEERFLAFGDAVQQLQFAFDNVDVQDIAREFLDAQVQAHGFSGSLVEAAEAASHQQRQTGDALAVLYAWTEQVALADDATREGVFASEEYEAALAALPPELRALIEGTEGAGDGTDDLAGRQASAIDTMSRYQDYLSDVNHILDEYSAGIDTALGHGGDWVRQHYDMAKGFREFADSITDGEGEIDLLTQGIDANTEAGGENAGTILDMADGIIAMTKANLEAGKSQEETTREYQTARTALLDAAEAAGLNRVDVEKLIDTYGLVPELVTTAMQIANDALMKWRIDQYIAKLDEIPEEEAVAIEAAIDAGDWAEANRLLRVLTAPRGAPITPYLTRSELNVRVNQVINPFSSAVGRFIPGGSNLLTTTAEIGGSRGDEVILPLGDPGRMATLLGMSQVGPRVAAALGRLTPYSSPLMSGSSANGGVGSNSSVVNVVVNMPPGADGDDVVRALKQWQRRSGPIPIAVR